MREVTAQELREAAVSAGIERVPHHDCALCGYETAYIVDNGALYFDPGCDCTDGAWPEPRSWQSAAGWVNMQDDEWRAKLAARFGLTLGDLP